MKSGTTQSGLHLLHRIVGDLVDVSARTGRLGSLDETARAQLHHQLVDAFENGEVEDARNVLIGQSVGTFTTDHQLHTLFDSALQSLGVDITSARNGWKLNLQSLGKADPFPVQVSARMHPARELFRGMAPPVGPRTAAAMQRLSANHARLMASIEKAQGAEEPVPALRALQQRLDLEDLPDLALMALMTAFVEHEAWTDAREVFEQSAEEFSRYPVPRRAYALACLQTGATTPAQSTLETLVNDGEADNVTLGMLGKVYLHRHDQAKGRKAKTQWLDKALDTYQRGFRANPAELYPAVCVPPLLEIKGDLQSRMDARRIAKVILTSAEQRVDHDAYRYWACSAALNMSVVLKDDLKTEYFLNRTLNADAHEWQLHSTISSLERLRGARHDRGENTTSIDRVLEQLSNRRDQVRELAARTAGSIDDSKRRGETEKTPELSALLDNTYRFGGRKSRRLTGNYHLDGIAHDVRVTPADVTYFTRVVKAAGLTEIHDPREACAKMDGIIRAQFNTETMEDLTSAEHERFDEVMPALARYMGAHDGDSVTNVSADWINKLADCRQHAPVKLLLFESWKAERSRQLMQAVEDHSRAGDEKAANAAALSLEKLHSWQLRILDAVICNRDTGEPIEEHTMTLLLHKRPMTPQATAKIDDLYLADSFYHQVHRLGEGEVQLRVDGDEVTIDVPNPSLDGTNITLKPAAYSYDRSRRSVDSGELRFRGIQVASPGWEREVPVEGIDLDVLQSYVHEHYSG